MELKALKALQFNTDAVSILDDSAYDEKFEIILEKDYICNISHIENKYYVPILNGSFSRMFDYSLEYLVHKEDTDFARKMSPEYLKELTENHACEQFIKIECRQKLVDGSFRWVRYVGVYGTENGVPEGRIYFYVFDIQNIKSRNFSSPAAAAVKRSPLTGLRESESFIPSVMELVANTEGPWCCLAIDIQHFKVFCSWFGQEKGDYLLSLIGSALRDFEQREPAAAAYCGNDNFALFLRHEPKKIQQLYNRIRDIVSTFSNAMGFLPAFGIFLIEEGVPLPPDIYDKACLAVVDAKKNYSECIKYFDSAKYMRRQKEFELMKSFLPALENGEVSFYIQPQCRISDGKIVGGEALARWIKPDGSIISPGAFVPNLEANGFIAELDRHVWESVCIWVRNMLHRGIIPPPISVNVSQFDIMYMDVAAYLYALTQRYSIPPKLINVEITESSYAANFDIVNECIKNLRQKGFLVFMDDFGTGFSSLNMLDKITADLVKLDMNFMRKDNALSRKGISIVESIFSMTRALEIPVIMEGVENSEQAEFLQGLGCKYVQGYYLYRPMKKETFEELISNEELLDRNGFESRITELFHSKEFLNENLFTESTLNNILGAVAFYTLEGDDLTISRYNVPFYKAIGDAKMDTRLTAIQNFVVREDRPALYTALLNAETNISDGAECEIRFFKSDDSVFWFRLHFYYLKSDGSKKQFYGKIHDITEAREQTLQFLDMQRQHADSAMCINLDRGTIQYITREHTLYQSNLPSMPLHESMQRTVENRILSPEDKRRFIEFFDPERLREAYDKAIYHEILSLDFKLASSYVPVNFSTYCIRSTVSGDINVYTFVKAKK